ncbi:hypothetical protein NEH83_14580 [Streptomyces sp. JUS-F4]|nr:hypothetical protein [Streptomyces sp. JUS-F4]WKN15322.1 hypothetical protein NEH83_14580 [Streptomyces sp. JUS-F4]
MSPTRRPRSPVPTRCLPRPHRAVGPRRGADPHDGQNDLHRPGALHRLPGLCLRLPRMRLAPR